MTRSLGVAGSHNDRYFCGVRMLNIWSETSTNYGGNTHSSDVDISKKNIFSFFCEARVLSIGVQMPQPVAAPWIMGARRPHTKKR